LPAVIGTISVLARWKSWIGSHFHHKTAILLFSFFSFFILSLGGRFYQQYYVVLLPTLCALSAVAMTKNSVSKLYLTLGLLLLSITNMHLVYLFATGHYKNSDSEIQFLISEIQKDTQISDTIWINHNLQSIYFLTKRQPAIKYIQFSHLIGYADPCKAAEIDLKEDPQNDHFRLSMQQLTARPPKIVFWTQRASNSCSNKVHLENFPSVQNFLNKHYVQKWVSPLGIYYLLKPSAN
jgi:hypothetical protein